MRFWSLSSDAPRRQQTRSRALGHRRHARISRPRGAETAPHRFPCRFVRLWDYDLGDVHEHASLERLRPRADDPEGGCSQRTTASPQRHACRICNCNAALLGVGSLQPPRLCHTPARNSATEGSSSGACFAVHDFSFRSAAATSRPACQWPCKVLVMPLWLACLLSIHITFFSHVMFELMFWEGAWHDRADTIVLASQGRSAAYAACPVGARNRPIVRWLEYARVACCHPRQGVSHVGNLVGGLTRL